jgi:hypothetical protein
MGVFSMIIAKCKMNIDPFGNWPIDLVIGDEYEVSNIYMGRWMTDIYLKGKDKRYNSVMFDFYEDGEKLDIFKDDRWNPYIRRKKVCKHQNKD